MTHTTVLEVKNLTKAYDKFFLDNINFTLKKGEITGLIGPNGSGKSTTMKLILRILEPDSGEVLFNNTTIYSSNNMLYKTAIGYVGENIDYFEKSKLKDIKNFYKSFYSNWDEAYYKNLMDKFELMDSYKIKELSKGMRVKFSLCLALSHSPELLLMDEPTSGLDPLVRNELLLILKDYAKNKKVSILFSSHITEDMSKIADNLIFIYKGKIIEICKTKMLLDKGIAIDSYLENLIKIK